MYIQNPNVNGFDYLLIRGISIAVLSIIQVIYWKVNIFTIQPEYKTTVYAYAIVGGSGVFAFYFGFKFIPASIGILIFYINPVLIAAVAPFILNEVLTKEKVIVVLGSFAGAAILLLHKNILPGDTDHYYLGAILTFVTWCTGTWMSLISRMVAGKIHYSIWPFYYWFYWMLVLFLMLVVDYSMFNIEKLSLYDLSMFLLSGVFGFVGGNIRFVAFQYEEASKVAPFGYFEVFIVLLFDIFAFKYSFVLTDIIGGFFIIVSYHYIIYISFLS